MEGREGGKEGRKALKMNEWRDGRKEGMSS